ncbi:putative phage abortive infection protein [Sediminispirochaeta smaragdinae]|uniref:putative phage abortive infection protein n=1 Tax=Sediminispirochaeta smaragdinae TaxID=55206 RepID=UPI0038996977
MLYSNEFDYSGWYFDLRFYNYGYGLLLSRYFRFQFQIVKFIDEYQFNKNDFSNEEIREIKYQSAKLFRSQLTNNEQLLLYYNSITPLGGDWNINNYIRKYKLIKNIILPQVFGYSPVEWVRNDLSMDPIEEIDFFEFKDKIYG